MLITELASDFDLPRSFVARVVNRLGRDVEEWAVRRALRDAERRM